MILSFVLHSVCKGRREKASVEQGKVRQCMLGPLWVAWALTAEFGLALVSQRAFCMAALAPSSRS